MSAHKLFAKSVAQVNIIDVLLWRWPLSGAPPVGSWIQLVKIPLYYWISEKMFLLHIVFFSSIFSTWLSFVAGGHYFLFQKFSLFWDCRDLFSYAGKTSLGYFLAITPTYLLWLNLEMSNGKIKKKWKWQELYERSNFCSVQ